ncbi:MAG: hypothetical protein SVX38_07365 [Chloroflexota bacterium]|nr:hypothetical protein [Chloroflexota bacterium]
MQDWIWLLVGIALSSGIFALLVVLYPKLRSEKQGYPLEAIIEPLLLPLIYEGICAAYRMSEQAVDEGMERIRGVDKKTIADGIYAMLPDRIGDYDIALVKSVVSKERFGELVQDAFNRFDRFYIVHKTHFDEQFERWKKINALAA